MNIVAPASRRHRPQPGRDLAPGRRTPTTAPGGGPHRRAGPVGRQLQHRDPGQLLPPVPQLPLQHLPGQPLPLPHREVGVLHRQRRQRIRLPRTERLIQRRQLTPQDPRRPLIEDHVVRRQRQHVLPGGHPDQARRGSAARPPGQTAPPHRPPPAPAPPPPDRPPRTRRPPAAGTAPAGRSPGTAPRPRPATSRVRSTSCRAVTAPSAAPSARDVQRPAQPQHGIGTLYSADPGSS